MSVYNIVEQARALHEDLEVHERIVCKELMDKEKKEDDGKKPTSVNAANGNEKSARQMSKGEKLAQAHRVKRLLETMQDRATKLARIFEDKDGSLNEDVNALAGDAAVSSFYERLRELKEFHRRRKTELDIVVADEQQGQGEKLMDPSLNSRAEEDRQVLSLFTGEEAAGRYIDVHVLHETFINASFHKAVTDDKSNVIIEKMSYKEYLEACFSDSKAMKNLVPLDMKLKGGLRLKLNSGDDSSGLTTNAANFDKNFKYDSSMPTSLSSVSYAEYLLMVYKYLRGYFGRTQPLLDIDSKLAIVEDDCIKAFDEKSLHGWDKLQSTKVSDSESIAVPKCCVDLDAFSSSEELLSGVGVEIISDALKELGLKAGGLPKQRADRLFSMKGISNMKDVDPMNFANASKSKRKGQKMKVNGNLSQSSQVMFLGKTISVEQRDRKIKLASRVAVLEAKIAAMLEMNEMKEVVKATIANVERKQALTFEEMQAEAIATDFAEDVLLESDEEDDVIYNPLKLPLGWDGKPIPYWLYKLHGLNQEFRCEICGNSIYHGRRAFEKHFTESKHQMGLRALGIVPGKEYHEITDIKDALDLQKSMNDRGVLGKGAHFKVMDKNSNFDEEFEDDEGNVYNRKTYEDLKRQGLI